MGWLYHVRAHLVSVQPTARPISPSMTAASVGVSGVVLQRADTGASQKAHPRARVLGLDMRAIVRSETVPMGILVRRGFVGPGAAACSGGADERMGKGHGSGPLPGLPAVVVMPLLYHGITSHENTI
jgi:hypothetical protein